ncbi:MAG: hypothetical protein QMD53_04025 [Actinomycetota bacterium]|nr:hypothetical protein [Actinomycetota bacterium]
MGAEVLSCGTCLDYYGLKEDLVVGKISNMYDTTESFKKAEKILSI